MSRKLTLHETNVAPENGWLDDGWNTIVSFWDGLFSGATVDGKNPAPLGMPLKVLIVV